MNANIQTITLDLTNSAFSAAQKVSAVQGDSGTRPVKAIITDNGVVRTDLFHESARLYISNANGERPTYVEGISINGGIAEFSIPQSATLQPGIKNGELRLVDKDEKVLSSMSFIVEVASSQYDENALLATDDGDVLARMVEQARTSEEAAADSAEAAQKASQFAVSYSEEQSLTDEQKAQARNNINAVDASCVKSKITGGTDIPNGDGLVDFFVSKQNFLPEQKQIARDNIDAASQENQYIATPTTELSQRLGEELATANGWTLDGWTGDFANGFTHTVGSTGKLTYTLGNTGTKTFYLEFDVAVPDGTSGATSSAFTVTIGNSPRFIAYNDGGSKHYVFGIKSVEDGNLEFIPTLEGVYNVSGGNFNGTISNISLKEVVADAEPTIVLKDADGNVYEEKRILFDSVYVGKNSGAKALRGGELNTAFGENALFNNTTGYWNTAMGWNALYANTVGSRNVALGKMALERNVSGDRNVGIGSFALCRNTDGRNNIAIGADSLWMNTTGERNIALGLASLGENIVGSDNIALGNGAGSSINGDFNIVLGRSAMSAGSIADMEHNIAIGAYALYKNQGHRNVAIGHEALYSNSTGNSNVAIGMGALKASVSGIQNVAIGWDSGKAVTTGNNNIFVGYNSGIKVKTGQENVLIGVSSGDAITSGRKNVVIGYSANSSANAQNTIAIGYRATATKDNSVVIGNDSIVETLLKGDLVVRGTDGTKRKIVFNTDGTCAWSEVT